MGERSIIDVDPESLARWSNYLAQVRQPSPLKEAWLRDLRVAMRKAEPYKPHGARQVTVTVDLVNEVDQVVRHRLTVPEGNTTTTNMSHDGPWLVRVICSESTMVARRLTPGEWGPIPPRCKPWPWESCPDCNGEPGGYHTATCGALDLEDPE